MNDSLERHFTNVYVLRREYNLTQEELASLSSVSTQLVLRAEQGLHPNLSTKIAKALSSLSGYSPVEIKEAYKRFRQYNIDQFRDDLTSHESYDNVLKYAMDHISVDSPFRSFRTFLFDYYGLNTSAVKFCTYTGLHTAILSSIENRKITWQEAPALEKVLYNVLHVPPKIVNTLGEMHDEWYLES